MRVHQAVTLLLAALAATPAQGNGEVFTLHGSGTTNPSKCFWHIMSLFEERSQISTRLTYRAVGSSAGITEFLGVSNSHVPHNDFGSGDIPVPTAKYVALNAAVPAQTGNGKAMVHLPFAISSVSFFHNIPGVPDGEDGIKLSPCLLARIFNGETQRWSAPEVILENQHLKRVLEATSDLPIYVARRVQGSSSTASVTQYLNAKCPNEWGSDLVGSKLDNWHASTHPCEGSAGMTACVKDNAGAIGYMESGHGWSEDLPEVNVLNGNNRSLTSRIAKENGGIAAAASEAVTPSLADSDWGDVDFINKPGEYTWPIVVMSYVYVRKDVDKFMLIEEERGLLKLFLESLYDDRYFGNCEALGFTKVPNDIKDKAVAGIDMVSWTFSDGYAGKNMWTFEFDTDEIDGMGQFVISSKRRSLAGVSIEDLAGAEKDLKDNVEYLMEGFHAIVEGESEEFRVTFMKMLTEEKRIEAALVLSALSFTMWMCVIVSYGVRYFM
jgi:ABC-type phosphate transport system substrate-binding protein